ncbi:hypothetical protein ACQ4PT_006959 [Festuca glaucescens]
MVEHLACADLCLRNGGNDACCFRLCVAGGLEKLEEERKAQKKYWEEHSKDLTVEAMMLDSRAADLDKEERPEILSLLPSYEGKSVLELGAGIGRFTGELAKTAGHVIAMDFIESVIKKVEKLVRRMVKWLKVGGGISSLENHVSINLETRKGK